MKKDKLQKIILNEDFNLVDVLDTLLESRGVIDGIDEMAMVITNYINNVLINKELKDKCFIGYDNIEDVDKYSFTIPVDSFNNIETLFMKKPIFHIHLFIMRNIYGDDERELGETNYVNKLFPKIINVDGKYYLDEPEFNLSYVLPINKNINMLVVADKFSHELVHAKRNFYEIIRVSEKRRENYLKNSKILELLNNDKKEEIKTLIGRILYLCSDDEINARANQLYYQLKQYRYLDRDNINQAVKKTKVYDFIVEFDEKVKILIEMESKLNAVESDYMIEIIKWIYKDKRVSKNPYEFLINLLIIRKNYFIRQINKVKERVLYEILTTPLKMGHPPKI